jgi:hypothetical protein
MRPISDAGRVLPLITRLALFLGALRYFPTRMHPRWTRASSETRLFGAVVALPVIHQAVGDVAATALPLEARSNRPPLRSKD